MKINKHMYITAIVVVVCIAAVAFLGLNLGPVQIKGAQDIRFGIDIRGGCLLYTSPSPRDCS